MKKRLSESLGLPIGLFLLACLVRLSIALPGPDACAGEMVLVAKTLARTGQLANPYGGTGPTAHETPIYPALLAFLIQVFGSHYLTALRTLTAIFSGLVAALIPSVATRTGLHRGAGVVAAVIFAAIPVVPVEVWGEWEQPFSRLCLIYLMIICCTALGYNWLRRWDAIRYGTVAGFSLLLAPHLLFVIALAPLQSLVLNWRHNFGRSILRMCQIGSLIIIFLVPWTVRNYWVLGGFVPLRSNFGLELYLGNNDWADGTGRPYGDETPHPYLNPNERREVQRLGELAYMRAKRQMAFEWIAGHPVDFLRLTRDRFVFLWFPAAELCPHQARPEIAQAFSFFCTLSILAFLDLGKKWILRDRYAWLWTVFLLFPCLIYCFVHVSLRYRTVIHPIILLMACDFAVSAFAWAKRVVMGERNMAFQEPCGSHSETALSEKM